MIKTKFWVYSVLVVLLVAANFYYTSLHEYEDVRTTAADQLAQAEKGFLRLEDDAGRTATGRATAAATAQPVVEALEASLRTKSPPTADSVRQVNTALGEAAARHAGGPSHTLLVLAGDYGAARLDLGKDPQSLVDVPDLPVLKAALGGQAGASITTAPDGSLERIAASPVTITVKGAPKTIGAILLGYPIADAGARAESDALGAEVTFMVGHKVVATSAAVSKRRGLAEVGTTAAPGKAFGYGKLGHMAPVLGIVGPFLETQPYAGYGRKVPLAGVDKAAVLLSTPVRLPLSRLNDYQMLEAGAFALVLLLGLVWAFFISQSGYGPAKIMAGALVRAAAGDMKARVEPRKFSKPFRRLAEAVNGVLDQAEKRAPGVGTGGLVSKDTDISAVLGGAPEPTPPPDAVGAGFPFDDAVSPEPIEPEPIEPEPAPAAGGFDPFGDAAPAAPPPQPAAPAPAPAASAEAEFFSDATRVVSLDQMQAEAQAAAAPAPAPASAPAPAPVAADDPFAAAMASGGGEDESYNPDATVVAKVPDALLQATARAQAPATPKDPDEEHFREVFREFVSTRQRCGEAADGLTFDKFSAKLRKNRDAIKDKHGARSVRFQVYVKEGKAALKATPIK